MKRKFLLAILFCISGTFLFAQDVKKKDTTQLTELQLKQKEVDTLKKYIWKQYYINNFAVTISAGELALNLAEEINDNQSYLAISSLLGSAFLQLEDTLQAKRIFLKSIDLAKSLNDEKNIVAAYIDLGNLYNQQEDYIKAIATYKKALPLLEKTKNKTQKFVVNFTIAQSYLETQNYDKAKYYIERTNQTIDTLTKDPYLAIAKLNEGKFWVYKDKPNFAIPLLVQSITLAEQSNYNDPLIDGYTYYSIAEAMHNNYEHAYYLMRKVDTLRIEKFTQDKLKAIEGVTARYKLNDYQKELRAKTLQNELNTQRAKREATLFWVKVASAIVLLSSIFIFISYIRRKRLLADLLVKNQEYLVAKEESEASSRAKTVLFSNITHELRTPMYGIIGLSNVLMDDKALGHQAENLTSMRFSANYLLSLVNNVLQFTKMESKDSVELENKKFNIKNILDNSVRSVTFLNTENPNNYIVNIDDKVPENLVGDEFKLSQVFINLLSNATKFTDNGTITTTVTLIKKSSKNVFLAFSIKDNGKGISEERQKDLFNDISKSSSNVKYQGTGIGLPIVKKILALHDAKVELKSKKDVGTEVCFKIYYGYEQTQEIIDKNDSSLMEKFLVGKKILVVDDNKINLLVTKKNLEKYGMEVTVAENGLLAIDIVKDKPLDLVLMDINMPGLNGFETTEKIREFNTNLPILAFTAVELEKVVMEMNTNIMDDYIIKPYRQDFFIETLHKHLSKIR